ncbi:MAG TPA: hypothetical protein VFG87_15205 [Amycolatopsis sp.]|jgi:hypothetical protein|nr:hypothetical protein [Amycolatopsis sp.]
MAPRTGPGARKGAGARKAPARTPALPPVTIARLEEALGLIDELVDEQTDVFVAKGHEYRERHRAGTERRLTAFEASQVAAAMTSGDGLPPVTLAVAVQESDLRAYDEPEPLELLLRAGVATAPGWMDAVKRFVALIEMDPTVFREARENETLDEALTTAVAAMAYTDLDGPDGMRVRSQHALEHFAEAAGAGPGKAGGLLVRALWQAVEQATSSLGLQRGPSSLTGSPPSTDGLSETSSTTSDTAKR